MAKYAQAIVDNLRFRWKTELSTLTDEALYQEYEDFSMSAYYGHNDEQFLNWVFNPEALVEVNTVTEIKRKLETIAYQAFTFQQLEDNLRETQALEVYNDINIMHHCSYTSSQAKQGVISYRTKHKVNASWGMNRKEFMQLFGLAGN